jgi:hypothetical protein
MTDELTTPAAVETPLPASNGGDPAADRTLSLDRLRARRDRLTKTVYLSELDSEIVVRKLPASILERKDIDELSPMVLALTEGVAEPEITTAIIAELTFEEATAIFEAVEAFNPGVISADDPEASAAGRRKAFPT